jgi:hypothetical protein
LRPAVLNVLRSELHQHILKVLVVGRAVTCRALGFGRHRCRQ